MPDRPAVIYEYDGSLEGLFTCIFDIYDSRRQPVDIQSGEALQEWLYPIMYLETDPEKAARVFTGLGKKSGPEAQQWVSTAFLYDLGGKEMAIYRFVRHALTQGRSAVRQFGHSEVTPIYNMCRSVDNEAHAMIEFLRFADLGGLLVAEIEPQHFVLGKMESHFTDRYPEEQFLIHDRTHQAALAYRPYESRLFFTQDLRLPDPSEADLLFQQLWKGYFRATTIEARANPLCQRTHCPQRFWSCMTEMCGETALPGRKRPNAARVIAEREAETQIMLPDENKKLSAAEYTG